MDEIIRELGENLTIGIETLLDAAKYEHKDVDVLKHLLRTASFANKYIEPDKLDTGSYVNMVKQ